MKVIRNMSKQPKEYAHYCGIMDCHGLESLHEYEERDAFFKKLRANSNPHRQAIFFIAHLSSDEFKEVGEYVSKEDWQEACNYLNACDFKYHGPGKIDLIPNPELDPYHA